MLSLDSRFHVVVVLKIVPVADYGFLAPFSPHLGAHPPSMIRGSSSPGSELALRPCLELVIQTDRALRAGLVS